MILAALAAELRGGESVISPHVTDPEGKSPALGQLAAAGPRTVADGPEYALLVEAVREGYLLHYGAGRIVVGADRDLDLLAGDYLYAIGLDRLARLGDLEAVRELADLISLVAQVHAGDRDLARATAESAALWLAVTAAIAAGGSEALTSAKAAVRAGEDSAADRLRSAALETARSAGIETHLVAAAEAIDFGLYPF